MHVRRPTSAIAKETRSNQVKETAVSLKLIQCSQCHTTHVQPFLLNVCPRLQLSEPVGADQLFEPLVGRIVCQEQEILRLRSENHQLGVKNQQLESEIRDARLSALRWQALGALRDARV